MTAPTKQPNFGFRAAEHATLSLCLPAGWPEGAGTVSWWWRGADGVTRHGQLAQLNELPANMRGGRISVWTPAAETMLTQVSLPTRSRAKIAQALPYALEDQLLGEPESLHFAYRPLADGVLAVAVTARERLQSWLNALQAADITPTFLSPAMLALPWDGHSWSLALDENEAIVRTGPWSGFTCIMPPDRSVPDELILALREARSKEQTPNSLSFLNPPAGIDVARWSALLQIPVQGREEEFWVQTRVAPALSLLQSEFSPIDQLRQATRLLLPAGVIMLVWLVLGLIFNLGQWWRLTHVERTQRQQMFALFRQTFPDARAVVDPPLQMARNLAALQSGGGRPGPGDMLALLAQTAPVLQSNPAVHVHNVQYADSSVTFELSVPDYQAMEALSKALAAQGLRAEVANANSHDGTVDGRIRVRPGAHS